MGSLDGAMKRSQHASIMAMLSLIMWNTCTDLLAEVFWFVMFSAHMVAFVFNSDRDDKPQ